MSDIMLDASMKFQNYPIKTVGKMHFTVSIYYYIISKYFKISKIAKNSKNTPPKIQKSPKIPKILRSSRKTQAK